MMQSVALTDSCQHDEDFVIVDAMDVEDIHHISTTCSYEDDLESYDYCEDVYSVQVPAVIHSFTAGTETDTDTDSSKALQTVTFQHDFLDYPLSYEHNLNQVEGDSHADSYGYEHEHEREHADGDANASERQHSFVRNMHSPGISLGPFGEANSSDETEGESASVSVGGSIAAFERKMPTSATRGEKETKAFALTTQKREEQTQSRVSSSSDKDSAYEKAQTGEDDSSVSSTSSKTSNSRVSNKKRRKQLKLAKKAAAAAAAAPALSSGLSPTRKKPTRKLIPVRSSNNRQVACATQSLASYREEVSRNINKKHR
jgi:hypothetical protein